MYECYKVSPYKFCEGISLGEFTHEQLLNCYVSFGHQGIENITKMIECEKKESSKEKFECLDKDMITVDFCYEQF